MYRKNDLAISEWSPENVTMCAERQREILGNAVKTVADGGYLLYSTCTYSTEENEDIVAWLLETCSDLRLMPCGDAVTANTADGVDVSGGKRPELALCRRFYPHVSRGEGQFLALFKRENNQDERLPVKDAGVSLGRAEQAAVKEFLKEAVGRDLKGLMLCGGNVTAFPPRESLGFPIPPFGVVAAGAVVGEVRKGRLVPHHHFFMAYGKDCLIQCTLSPSDGETVRYLAGEEIAVSDARAGFVAVMLSVGKEAVTLGGGKLSGGRVKNYYPKGLRAR